MAKKKSDEKNKNRDRQQPLDRRAMEKQLADVGKLLSEQQFESIEDANAFLAQIMSMGQPIPTQAAETPLDKAQEIIYEAFEASGRKRIHLAQKALRISQDCADAYVLLAEEAAKSPKEALKLYEKAVSAAESTLGPEMFARNTGHFWGILQTRPYMRARAGLAGVLWYLGRHDEAIEHWQALLRLNPNDNQGVRYTLSTALLAKERYEELADLLAQYQEGTASWHYTSALLEFRQKGATRAATRLVRQALRANPFVPQYLLGRKKMPKRLPEYIGFGDETEALDYVDGNFSLWKETPGALAWLSQHAGDVPQDDFSEGSQAEGSDDVFDLDPAGHFLAEDDQGYFPFESDEWLKALNAPRKEHQAIRRCLRRGAGAYDSEYYGRDRYKRAPQEDIDDALSVPFIYGYAVIAILEEDEISDETKEKVVEFALLILQPTAFQGIPYGLLQMVGYLAQRERLMITHLMLGLLALEFNSLLTFGPDYWTDGVTSPAMAALAQWIAASEELTEQEKLWLAWKLSVNCDSAAHLGKAFANTWLDHPAISNEAKRELCWSWLEENREVGVAPPTWRLMLAYMKGDLEEINRIRDESDLDLDELPLPDPDDVTGLAESGFISAFREHRHAIMSPYLKRLAIPTLVRLGEEIHEIVDLFWNEGDYYEGPILKAGVGDAIREFHDRLEPQELRRLIERGVNDGKAQVRKPFYLLSTEFYGDHYMRQALDDSAGSIRRWAKKKLEKDT